MIDARKVWNHLDINDLLEAGTVTHVFCHKKCLNICLTTESFSFVPEAEASRWIKASVETISQWDIGKTFDLKKHCLFCLEITECKLDSEYDAKTPVQYRIPASMFATTEMCDRKAFIETLMKKCRNRNDDLDRVVYCLLAVDGDVVAAEARYHRKCRCLFHKHSESNDNRWHSEVDTALLKTFEMLDQNRTKIWIQ